MVANENSPVQVGDQRHVAAIERPRRSRTSGGPSRAAARGRRVPLAADGAGGGADPRRARGLEFATPAFPIAENVSGALVSDPAELRELLGRHVVSPVRWEEDARALAAAGAAIPRGGPGDVLTKMAKRIVPGALRSRSGSPEAAARRGKLGAVTRHATITGVGSLAPAATRPQHLVRRLVETTDEWIRDRTGIEARHFADDGVLTSDLAVEAARGALETRRASRPSSST